SHKSPANRLATKCTADSAGIVNEGGIAGRANEEYRSKDCLAAVRAAGRPAVVCESAIARISATIRLATKCTADGATVVGKAAIACGRPEPQFGEAADCALT